MLAAKERLNAAGVSDERINELQNCYMTSFGEDGAVEWRIFSIKGGKAIASRLLTPGKKVYLDVQVDTKKLIEDDTWDMATVRITARNEHGHPQIYCQRALKLTVSGPIELIGPDCVPLMGGSAGCYVRSKGRNGMGKLEISADGIETVTVNFRLKNY